MTAAISTLLLLALWGGAAFLVGIFGQALDILNAVLDISQAKDSRLRGRAARRKAFENVWSIVGTLALALLLVLGVDVVARLFFDWVNPFWGFVLFVVLLLLAVAGGVAIVAGMVRGEGISYAVLRENLEEDAGLKLRSEQVAEFRNQLAQVDSRKRHIRFGLRDRAGLRPVRVRLDGIADEFSVVPPTGFGAVRFVRWKTANAYLWLGNPVRLLPAVVAIVVLVVLVVVAVMMADATVWLFAALALVAASASFLLALLEARVALAAKAAWHAVYQKQRLEAVRLLEELERTSRKGVAGLGDRVTRALQILRDAQN